MNTPTILALILGLFAGIVVGILAFEGLIQYLKNWNKKEKPKKQVK